MTVPHAKGFCDDNYLRFDKGLYPDLLLPHEGGLIVSSEVLSSLWIEINLPKNGCPIGETTLTVELYSKEGELLSTNSVCVEVIGAALPEQKLIFTQWFHCDCLAQYYGVEVFSDRRFEIIEEQVRVAVKNGINMHLVPVFTPPLDTAVGGERLTNQLVGVRVTKGRYYFSYRLLDRYIDMLDRAGVKYLEISHLFTQWGAKHAPKIMVTVDGEYKRIFGWDTDAHSREYGEFLSKFLKSFVRHMEKRGDAHRLFFHISDEPSREQLPDYRKSKELVEGALGGYPIMDALSNIEYYKEGIVKTPIPATNHIDPFLDENIEGLWTYYCCSQAVGVSNRFLAMPSYRNRYIGMQMYKYGIKGFLHWGYNFYNSRFSLKAIDPYLDTCADLWVPAGDAFSVYPARDGGCLESLRILVFHEGLCDIRAIELCESLYSKERVVAELEECLGEKIVFSSCVKSEEPLLLARERINELIKAKL